MKSQNFIGLDIPARKMYCTYPIQDIDIALQPSDEETEIYIKEHTDGGQRLFQLYGSTDYPPLLYTRTLHAQILDLADCVQDEEYFRYDSQLRLYAPKSREPSCNTYDLSSLVSIAGYTIPEVTVLVDDSHSKISLSKGANCECTRTLTENDTEMFDHNLTAEIKLAFLLGALANNHDRNTI